jgi:hypothetical protein
LCWEKQPGHGWPASSIKYPVKSAERVHNLSAGVDQVSTGQDSAVGESAQYYVFPASRAQYQMFFVQTLLGDVPTYNVAMAYDLHGPRDEAALRSALSLLVDRHEALRTHFALSDGALLQMIDPEGRLDYLAVRDSDRAWLDQQASLPFDLERGPLFQRKLSVH